MAGGVQEGDLLAVLQPHLIGADVLGDAAGLAARHIGGPQRVQEAGLAVVDVAHDGHDRGAGLAGFGVVGLGQEAGLDVGFRHALDAHAVFLGHQFGGVGIDHVVDLHHQALTHQEFDDVDAAHGHAVGQFADGDGVGNDDLARTVRRIGRAALALFTLAFAGAAHRGQRAHPLGGVLVSTGHGLDGQAAFTALGFAARAADGLARTGVREALVAVILAAGSGRTAEARAGRTGHGGLGRRLVRAGTGAGTGARAAGTARAGGRTRVEGRIADRLGRAGAGRAAGGGAGAGAGGLLTVGIVALAAAHGGLAGRTAAEGRALDRGALRIAGLGRALAEIDGRAGRGGRTRGRGGGRSRCRSGSLGLGTLGRSRSGRRRLGGLGGRGGRSCGRQFGGLGAGGFGGGLGGGGFGLGGAGGLGGGRGLLARGGVAARLFGGLGLSAFGLLAGGQLDGLAAGLLLFVRQAAGGGGRGRARRGGRGGLVARTRDIEAGLTLDRAGRADAALGLDHHGLGAAVAEALLDGAGGDRPRRARLQAQRRARPRGGGSRRRSRGRRAVVGLVVLVGHPVASNPGRKDPPASSSKHKKPCGAPPPIREQNPARPSPCRNLQSRPAPIPGAEAVEIQPVVRPLGSSDRRARP